MKTGTNVRIYAENTVGKKENGEPEDVGIIIEGVKVLSNNGSVILAFIMLFGLVYALESSYPEKLKCTFEFIQKVIMNLDPHMLNTKEEQLNM